MKSTKVSTVIAVTALLAAIGSSAFADDRIVGDAGTNWQDHITSTKTRAEVRAELEQARAQGLLSVGEDPHYPRQPVATTGSRSRAEVRAEAAEAAKKRFSDPDPLYTGA